MPLRLSLFAAAAVLIAFTAAPAQNTLPKTYDVSTVKPSNQAENHGMMLNWGDAELRAQNITLAWILTNALHAREDQISGIPGWAKEKHFDITAKLLDVDKDALKHMTPEQNRTLLLALLVERFGLTYHLETRQMPTYDLVPAKSGLHLTPPAPDDAKSSSPDGICRGCSYWGNSSVKARDISMTTFTELLAAQLHRDVHDGTGFSGNFDVNLSWAPDLSGAVLDNGAPAPDSGSDLPPLPKALEQQMGLHLVSTRGPVKLYVIDHLDQPTAN